MWHVWKTEHLFAKPKERTSWPHQQLGRSARDEANVDGLLSGCMKGRTMFVIRTAWPIGFEHFTYWYWDYRLRIRGGEHAHHDAILRNKSDGCVGSRWRICEVCAHCWRSPWLTDEKMLGWPCNPNKYIVHYPEERAIVSYGSGYGGNALLGKKCFALRIASSMANEEGWLAEHMLILGVESPDKQKPMWRQLSRALVVKQTAGMIIPTERIERLEGDYRWRWHRVDKTRQRRKASRAINPEAGYFGVAPGTNEKSNPNAMKTISKNTIFTNVAITDDGDVCGREWQRKLKNLTDLARTKWDHHRANLPHPNARFAPASQCPSIDADWENPRKACHWCFYFGGRKPFLWSIKRTTGTMVFISLPRWVQRWRLPLFGELGKVRRDPFAMLPFCGYHMGDYFNHWL